jgi:hypothetical protein
MNEFADGYLLILMYIIELNTPKSQQYTAYIYAPDRMLTYTYTHRIIAAPLRALNSSQQPATKNFEEKMKMQNTQCVMYNNNNNTHIEHAQKTWGWEPTLVSVFFVLCFFLVLVLVVLFELLLFKCSNSLPLSIIGVWGWLANGFTSPPNSSSSSSKSKLLDLFFESFLIFATHKAEKMASFHLPISPTPLLKIEKRSEVLK